MIRNVIRLKNYFLFPKEPNFFYGKGFFKIKISYLAEK